MITEMSQQEKKQLLWAYFISGDIFIGVKLRFKVRLWLVLRCKVSVKAVLGQVKGECSGLGLW